ncbi:hypothetical protein EDF82_1627 [Raoultella sp. BIGb0399]|nr:hypothetical protein EDF82_1627 [Raoultella sp. BIGb0399]
MRKEGEVYGASNKEVFIFSWKYKDVQGNNIPARLYHYY